MFESEFEELADYDAGSVEVFKCKEGKNRVRILAGGNAIATHWSDTPGGKRHAEICFGMAKGCPFHEATDKKPSIKHYFYVLDKSKSDPKVHLAEFPYTVMKAIKAYSEEEGYEFSSLPMPYDIGITYDPKASPADMYKVIASPKQEPVDEKVLEELSKKKPVPEVVAERKAKAFAVDTASQPEEEIPTEDIGF